MKYKKLFSFLFVSVLFLVGGFAFSVPKVYAVAVNVATNIEVTPGTQFTIFKGVPVYRLVVTNSSGVDSDTITSLSPTPSGSVVDTTVTLHFYHDVNNNGIVDQGDVDIGADGNFGADNAFTIFNINDVIVPAAGSASILITADVGAGVGAQTFNLAFAAGTDIVMTTTPTGTFPLLNDATLTVSNSAPSVTIVNASNDPATKTVAVGASNVPVKRLAITAAAGTSDSIVSLAPAPTGTANDNTGITSVVFYIDSGTTPGVVDENGSDIRLVTTPATYTGDDAPTTFTFSSPFQVTAFSTVNILVVYNLAGGIAPASTLYTEIAAVSDVIAGSGTALTSDSSTISSLITIASAAPTLAQPTVVPASTVKASSAAKVIGAFRVTEAGGVSDTINQFKIENKTALTAVTADIASVAIYSDGGTLGIIDGADAVACAESTTVTTTEFNAGGSLINFTCSSPIVIGANATQNYLAVITTTVGATNGRTMATRVNAHLVTANAWAVADLSTTNSITIDTTVPTLSIGAPSSSLTATGPVTYLVTYGDPDGGADVGPITLAPGDITLVSTGTATGTVTSVDGPSLGKTIHITGISGNGTLGILSISAATAFDIADNTTLAAGASATFDVDNTAPTVTSVKTGDLTGVGLNKVTVIFSENVDVTLVNGTGWTVTGTDAGSRTVTANTDPAGTSSVMILTLSSPFASENPDATVTYTTGGGLVDNVGTELATGASPNIADGIKPTFVSAIATSDTNIEVTYSEAVTVTDDSSSGSDFTVFLSTSNVDPTKVDLTVSSLGNTAFTSDGLNLANGVVADTSPAHNTITQILSQHVSDGQAPSTPTANPPANTYTSTQSVILSSTDLTNIRYTIDGTDPSTYSSGTLYVGAISVSSSETIKARSCDDAGNISELGTFSYTINSSHGSSGGSVPRVINPLALSGGCKAGDLFSVITGARCNTTISLPSTPSATGVSSYAFGNTLVKLRTRDDYCRAWQHFFNDKFNGHLVTDGICGPLTIATAKAWQASVDLVTDGVLGPLSRAKASMQ